LWESTTLLGAQRAHGGAPETRRLSTFPDVLEALAQDAPGLSLLAHQVFGERTERAMPPRVTAVLARSTRLLAHDAEPFPPNLADLNVMKFIVGAAVHQRVSATYGPEAAAELIRGRVPKKLTLGDFRRFARELARSALHAYQSTAAAIASLRDAKLKVCRSDGRLTWQCLFGSYLVAYYNGGFVDRNGGTYSKPKLGMTISNETITSFTAILIEAAIDFSMLEASRWKAPIIYTLDVSNNPVWVTKDRKRPTLVDVVVNAQGQSPDRPRLPFVIEEAARAGSGMSKSKLCVARALGGQAGDGAQALSGSTVRLFGGADLGFVLMGKFSFGDNETLTRLVDTVVETLARRLTEGAVQHLLYDADAKNPAVSDVLKATLTVAEWIDGCKG
jgi:hypothetical protein